MNRRSAFVVRGSSFGFVVRRSSFVVRDKPGWRRWALRTNDY